MDTRNISLPKDSANEAARSPLGFLVDKERVFAENLINDWYAQMRHLERNKKKTCDTHRSNLSRLIEHAGVAPWKLRKPHVVKFFESRTNCRTGELIAHSTVAVYCSSWRSFQSFMLELDRVNEIVRTFKVRPEEFITEENSIGVKKARSVWQPKSYALSDDEIDRVDAAFRAEIKQAHRNRSKSLLPLIRDRVMFHLTIHFALRVSELVTIRLQDFHPHHDPKLRERFDRWGTLRVTGKNDTTGTIPMREIDIYNLLEWYVANIRQKLLMRRRTYDDQSGLCEFDGEEYVVSQLLFPSERGGVINPATFRARLQKLSLAANLPQRLKPHDLRHTGCTKMVPLYSPEIAQKYMRHRWLSTTMTYYHPDPLDAGNEVDTAFGGLFDDDDD